MPSSALISTEILDDISTSKQSADRVIKRHFRKHGDLTNPLRARIARDVHGVRCYLRRLDYKLSAAGLSPDNAKRIAFYRIDIDGAEIDDIANDFSLKRDQLAHATPDSVIWPSDELENLGIQHSIPEWVAARFIEERGKENAHALAAALNQPGPITIRARTTLNTRVELIDRLNQEGIESTPSQYAPHGLHLSGRPDIRGSSAWKEGCFEVQDEGSQLIAQALAPEPGETIIDLCAGAGGKTLAIADEMGERGTLIAADIDGQRLQDLRVRLKRNKIQCVEPIQLPEGLLPMDADRVLVDAPCSAIGTWRRGPDRRWHSSELDSKSFAVLQLELLETANRHLRPGGRLVYATCTLVKQENEAVIRKLLAREPELELLEHKELTPHTLGTDGFFVCTLLKNP